MLDMHNKKKHLSHEKNKSNSKRTQFFFTLSGIHISLLLSGFLFELHVAEVHYASSQLVHAHLLIMSEAQHIKGFLWTHAKCKEDA